MKRKALIVWGGWDGHEPKPGSELWASILAMLKYSLVDDIYREDEYGSNILNDLQSARRFNQWMGDTLRPFLGDRILEIGAGIGNLTNQFIPRELYVATVSSERSTVPCVFSAPTVKAPGV